MFYCKTFFNLLSLFILTGCRFGAGVKKDLYTGLTSCPKMGKCHIHNCILNSRQNSYFQIFCLLIFFVDYQ